MADAVHSTILSRRAVVVGAASAGTAALVSNGLAEPASMELLANYHSWLQCEFVALCKEMAAGDAEVEKWAKRALHFNAGSNFFDENHRQVRPPSTRAASVLNAVGCDWRNS